MSPDIEVYTFTPSLYKFWAHHPEARASIASAGAPADLEDILAVAPENGRFPLEFYPSSINLAREHYSPKFQLGTTNAGARQHTLVAYGVTSRFGQLIAATRDDDPSSSSS